MTNKPYYKFYDLRGKLDDDVKEDIAYNDFDHNGMAMLFCCNDSPEERVRMCLKSVSALMNEASNIVRNMNEIRVISDEGDVVGDIDGDIRMFILKQASILEYISNCSTFSGKLDEFYEFDKMEIGYVS